MNGRKIHVKGLEITTLSVDRLMIMMMTYSELYNKQTKIYNFSSAAIFLS